MAELGTILVPIFDIMLVDVLGPFLLRQFGVLQPEGIDLRDQASPFLYACLDFVPAGQA